MSRRLQRRIEPPVQLTDRGLERLLDQLFAVAKVKIDGPLGDARLFGDLLHRRRSHPLARDDADSRLLNGLDAELLNDFFFGFGHDS